MMAHTENLWFTFACFFAACRDGHWSCTLGYAQFDNHKSGFIVPLLTNVLADLDAASQ